jgi:hypothetical protein
MLSLILSTLGLGGAALALRIFAPGVWAMLSGIVQAIPPKVWLVIAGLAALGGAWWWHTSTVKAAYNRGYAKASVERDAAWRGAFDKMNAAAQAWRENFDQRGAQIAAEIGARNAQELRANAARADALRLRGPGRAAACINSGGAASLLPASGGHDAPAGSDDAGVAGLPDETPMAILPWPDLIQRSEDADADRAEVKAWREWYARTKAEWEEYRAKLKRELPSPKFGGAS